MNFNAIPIKTMAIAALVSSAFNAHAASIATRADLNKLLGNNLILEDFETPDFTNQTRYDLGPLNYDTDVPGLGKHLVKEGITFQRNPDFTDGSGYRGIDFNPSGYFGSVSKVLSGAGGSGGASIRNDFQFVFTTPVTAFGVDLIAYKDFPSNATISVYDTSGALIADINASGTAGEGTFFGWENAGGISKVTFHDTPNGSYMEFDNVGFGSSSQVNVLPKIVDMTKPACSYVASIYNKMWQEMKVEQAPSCKTVQNYYTWTRSIRVDNETVASAYSNWVNNLKTNDLLFNARMAKIDESVSFISDSLDLKTILSVDDYKLSSGIMKSRAILKSFAAGKISFDRQTTLGKIIDKTLKEKIITDNANDPLCDLFFDNTVAKSCNNKAKKIANCTLKLATKGWEGAASCVVDSVTSTIGFMNTTLDTFNAVEINRHISDYKLINDYLDDYFAKGKTQIPTNAQLETDIKTMTEQSDYDIAFVKTGIKDSIASTKLKSAQDLALTESLRKMLPKNP